MGDSNTTWRYIQRGNPVNYRTHKPVNVLIPQIDRAANRLESELNITHYACFFFFFFRLPPGFGIFAWWVSLRQVFRLLLPPASPHLYPAYLNGSTLR